MSRHNTGAKMTIFARRALIGSVWARDLRVVVDAGRIATFDADTKPVVGDVVVDTLLPAMGNLHSHSFQRAMAGMTERQLSGRDSFWSWRELMYRFLDRLTPEQIEDIAALVFMEMLESGYAAVGEFHYVHHQPGGVLYDDIAELSARICSAALETGIGLTHLPVLYSYGGADRAPLMGGQLRFGNDLERYSRLLDATRAHIAHLPSDAAIGIAPHSLRATSPEDLKRVLELNPDGPIHIHIAEQTKEVEDISAWLGARPVEWLLGNVSVDDRWCLIHATHMTESETHGVAQSGAVVGLCPITESNLGDGIFNGARYLSAGGAFGIGSDSNVRIALGEELRVLEYAQRLRDRSRNVLAPVDQSVGKTLYLGAARGAAQALGRDSGVIAIGRLADLMSIDSSIPALCALHEDQILDGLIFATGEGVVRDVWSAGRHVVVDGRHHARGRIEAKYCATVQALVSDE